MCGIVGSYHTSGAKTPPELLKRMTDAMRHRGPDGEGFFFANTRTGSHCFSTDARCGIDDANLAFGHRRLAILDLSEAGRQPMIDRSGSFCITYNGEIYTHAKLRRELEEKGVVFHSRSDTETVLQAYAMWGEECVTRFNGMFAFAIWDRPNQRLFLARDRFGVKPLYYALSGDTLVFGSEIKAMLPHPALARRVCAGALDEYFTFQNILTDRTLFDGVLLLPAGHSLTVDLRDAAGRDIGSRVTKRLYWDYRIPKEPLSISLEEAAEETRRLFVNAVERQMMSDVPVGGYLSGGMDSGSIVAVASKDMKTRNLGRFHTFTGGFDMSSASGLEMGCDERQAAEVLANLFKTEHYENVLHAGDMEHVMPELIWHLEDLRVGQCYPNYYTSRLASKFVKVCLAGSGGDELFAGYPWRYYQAISGGCGDAFLDNYYRFWQRLVPDADKASLLNSGMARSTDGRTSFDIFKGVVSGLGRVPDTAEDCVNTCLYFELKTFLNGLLIVDDKTSMAHSMETRVPFLDNDLVDFALQLPVSLKLKSLAARVNESQDENDVSNRSRYEQRTHDGKMVLRQAMRGLIPPETVERTKQGFSAPDASWFRGESIDYIHRFLLRKEARIYDFLEPDFVRAKIGEHEAGKANHRLFIWSVLSFEWWCRRFLDGAE